MTYDYEEYEVQVQCAITTTVKVRAKNPLSAAKVVDDVNYKLPDYGTWDVTGPIEYMVFEPGRIRLLYTGDAQELT